MIDEKKNRVEFSNIETEVKKEAVKEIADNDIKTTIPEAPAKIVNILDAAKNIAEELKGDIKTMFRQNHINTINAMQLASEGVEKISTQRTEAQTRG